MDESAKGRGGQGSWALSQSDGSGGLGGGEGGSGSEATPSDAEVEGPAELVMTTTDGGQRGKRRSVGRVEGLLLRYGRHSPTELG